MEWDDNFMEFVTWARDPNVTGGDAFRAALATVPDDVCVRLGTRLNFELQQDRDGHGLTASEVSPTQPMEPQLYSETQNDAYFVADGKLKDGRLVADSDEAAELPGAEKGPGDVPLHSGAVSVGGLKPSNAVDLDEAGTGEAYDAVHAELEGEDA